MPEAALPSRLSILGPFAPFRGGIAQFNDRLRQEVASLGTDVQAVSFSRQYPGFLFPGTSQFDPSRQGDALRLVDSVNPLSWRRAARAIRRFAPHALVAAYWTPHLAPALAGVAAAAGVRTVGLVHNALPHDGGFLARPLARRFLNTCDAVLTLSEAVGGQVAELGFGGRQETAHHPVYDHFGTPADRREARRELGLPESGTVLLCLGLVRPYKGYDRAVHAFEAVRAAHPDTTLVIAGEAYDDVLDKELGAEPGGRSVPKPGVVRDARYIPDSEVPLFYSAADALLLPYRSGTQSGALAAAAHFGLPVVVTPVPGLQEPVETFDMGEVCGSHDTAQLVQAVLRLMEPGRLEAAGAGSRRMAQERSWADFARRLMELAA